MPNYRIQVTVNFDYEVEAENEKDAEEYGWKWDDYAHYSDVYSIDVEELEEDEED